MAFRSLLPSLLFCAILLSSFASAQLRPPSSESCTDIHVVFARGSTEPQGLGITGRPLVEELDTNLRPMSVSSHAVVYAALASQTSAGPGASAMTRQVTSYAARCPNASFVIGGYSQGGSVTDIAIGIRTILGRGDTIPTTLAPRIKAIVVFGNPLKLTGKTIPEASPLYGAKAIEYCNFGDPVCAGGVNPAAHLMYHLDGSVKKAAKRAADKVRNGESAGNDDSDRPGFGLLRDGDDNE